jgi:rfaE bifunctional protein kinase chain/domain
MSEDFFLKYSFKIKNPSDIRSIIKKFPRKKKVILCHGVFDVVHPGHVRHLAYAKTRADILIVSITADKFITKGVYRPHVPQRLRALNLAAFEMVDYVLIDNAPTPYELLKYLKPDSFAKGFEYTSKGLPKATALEKKILSSYGGKLIFTPGDVVYSSSKFLNLSLPNLNYEKLLLLMKNSNLSFKNLRDYIKKINKLSVHVVGDTIVDSYSRTNFVGGQTKTPTFSVLFDKKDDYIGGAAIVALHLKAAGAKVVFSTIIGNDVLGKYVISHLRKSKIIINYLFDNNRPTTNKNTFISSSYRLLKVDTLDNTPISEETIEKFIKKIKSIRSDIVIFSDFKHGIFHKNSTEKFCKSIPKKSFKVADSQVASRWGNITDFKNFDLITPNEKEARFSLADQDSTVGGLAGQLKKKTNYKNIILKLGSRGVVCCSEKKRDEIFSIDSFADNVLDPVGSGDALLAYASLVLKVSNSIMAAGIIGSIAAACECEIDGNKPVTPDLVFNKIDIIEKKTEYNYS